MVEIIEEVRAVELAPEDGLETEAYILECEGGLILVDTGYTPRCMENIEAELEEMGKGWGDIKLILITHAHGDHIENLPEIRELTGAEVMIGEGDLPRLEERTEVRADVGLCDGDVIGACGGIQAIHVPGHSSQEPLLLPQKARGHHSRRHYIRGRRGEPLRPA